MIKYSIVFPYYKRPEVVLKTLRSLYKQYSGRTDYEVIFVLDLKNTEQDREQLFSVLEQFWHKIRLLVITNDIYSYNSSRSYNLAVQKASGNFIVLSNPECAHKRNVLKGFDEEFSKDPDVYVVCSCASLDSDGNFSEWYQHSKKNNRKLHFCSAISRDNFLRSGGFNEDYIFGIAFEDNEWLKRVEKYGYRIVLRDDLVVCHLDHSRVYLNDNLVRKNKVLFESLWREIK